MSKNETRLRRKKRVRAKIKGTGECPRLCVFRSNRHIYAQVVDDLKGKTLVSISSNESGAKVGRASVKATEKIGEQLAEKCSKLKIKSIVFDRGGYRYHGRVKALAEGARKGGLEF